jgi:hypothetical protein
MKSDDIGFFLAQVFVRVLTGFVSLVASVYFLLFVYDCVVKLFQHAFGIELPNPIDWMPLLLRP